MECQITNFAEISCEGFPVEWFQPALPAPPIGSLDTYISDVLRLAKQLERVPAPGREKLASGPWRSAGGHFDYSEWIDRQRFRELDELIALRSKKDNEVEEDEFEKVEFALAL